MANLFAPKTIDESFEYNGHNPVGGIKDGANDWDIAGHKDRMIYVDEEILNLFAGLYGESGTPALEARLPALHAHQLVDVLRKFAAYPRRLANLGEDYLALEMWHETNAQKDGTIRRETRFARELRELILSGPHFHVARPFYKCPQEVCDKHHDFDILDPEIIPDDYLPRTNFVPACDPAEYRRRTSVVPWGDKGPVTDYGRVVFRRMLSQSGERTLISCMRPRFEASINTVFSLVFKDPKLGVLFCGTCHSVPFDFLIKSTGKSDFRGDLVAVLPLLDSVSILLVRTLALNCMTTHYADLWTECWNEEFQDLEWLGDDPRLDLNFWRNLTPSWQRNCVLRTDYARRWALVELDVLVARRLGLTLEELQAIYRIQFPVMKQFDADTWYDQKGRIIFTNNSQGLPGVGLSRAEWNEVKDMTSGTITRKVVDATLPEGPVERTIIHEAPFTRCDREMDYAVVWQKLAARK